MLSKLTQKNINKFNLEKKLAKYFYEVENIKNSFLLLTPIKKFIIKNQYINNIESNILELDKIDSEINAILIKLKLDIIQLVEHNKLIKDKKNEHIKKLDKLKKFCNIQLEIDKNDVIENCDMLYHPPMKKKGDKLLL